MDNQEIKYPIYIVSKGRWENAQTAKMFMAAGIPFRVCVEPQEYKNYSEALGKERIIVTDFSNLGYGSFPARNYIWEHSISEGHRRHFIFDDNIRYFYRLNNGKRTMVDSSGVRLAIKTLERLTDRYTNVGISGFNYTYFVTAETNKPFYINTHVYSALLIDNSLSIRWRLKYNEDVDLCLQVLAHKKLCTLLLNVFSIHKTSTVVKMKGGNQDELYCNNDNKKKALKSHSLRKVWPQYVKVVNRFGRPHHQITWNKYFKHPLLKAVRHGN